MRNATTEKPGNERVYTFRVDAAQLKRIHEIARSEHRNLSGKLRMLIDQEIERHDREAAA